MTQGIKIPVSADVGPAEKAVDQLSDALGDVAAAAGAIGAESDKASRGLGRMVEKLEDLVRLKDALGRDGFDLSDSDVAKFAERWKGMRKISPGLRQYDDYASWREGIATRYGSPGQAEAQRRKIQSLALQGTDYSRARGDAPDGTGGDEGGGGGRGGGGGGGGGGAWGDGLARARSQAMGFGKSMLALAGINSAMAMAGRALDNATEESTGIDTLKRRMGDLGVNFEELQAQARAAGQGLGVTYVESQRLAQSYARTVGNLSVRDVGGIGGSVRIGEGLSRAYGLDLEEGNQFYASMSKYGVARDEQSQRRLALMIGDSVARSGYSGKVDELLGAITNYSAIAARQTLTTPNVGAYTSGLTSLIGKYAGLGPNEAASLIGQADSSVRHGGAMGEASQSFMYSALRNFSSGLSAVDAIGLMEGGLFGTTRSTFGAGGPLAGRGRGIRLDNKTTFEKLMETMRPHYKDAGYMDEAMKGLFGLSSQAQAHALSGMAVSGDLGKSVSLLQAAGVDPSSVSVTGYPTVGKIANANGAGLRGIYGSLSGRKDLTAEQRAMLEKGKAGSDDDLRKALVRVAAALDQEATKGTAARESIAGLNNALTQVGADLLGPINTIRDAVVATAQHFMPGYVNSDGMRGAGSKNPYTAGSAGKSGVAGPLMKMAMGLGMTGLEAAGMLGNAWAESGFDPRKQAVDTDGQIHSGLFQMDPKRWTAYLKWAKGKGFADPGTHLPQLQYALEEMKSGSSEWKAGAQLHSARDIVHTTAAGVRYERPAGYHSSLGNYSDAAGWPTRLGAAQELLGIVEVQVKQPNGTTDKHQVPIRKPIAAPKPAGTVSYPSTQDDR